MGRNLTYYPPLLQYHTLSGQAERPNGGPPSTTTGPGISSGARPARAGPAGAAARPPEDANGRSRTAPPRPKIITIISRLLERLLPKRAQETDPSRPRYLDESALETPSLSSKVSSRVTAYGRR